MSLRMTQRVEARASVSLALGSGGARGCAHIGVIRRLEAAGIRPVGIAGASMGALVGALYALGTSADELASLNLGSRIRGAIRPRFTRTGLLDPAPLADVVHGLIGTKTFAEAGIPLAITAVDLEHDERVVLDDGPIAQAVVASMRVHTVFPPLRIGHRWLSDPGIINSVPVDVAAEFGAEVVIAVSADVAPSAPGRLMPCEPPLSWLLGGAGRLCGAVGMRTRWPWVRHVGGALTRVSRGKAHFAVPCRVIWIQPAFGRMNANQFGACERAITLGEEAVERTSRLLQAVLAPAST
jgi:predicted acylesterase/phospholipase RssA